MNYTNSKIFLTYELGGEYLRESGKYESATTKQVEGSTVIVPLKVIKKPVMTKATITVELSSEFINTALERSKPPKNSNARWWRGAKGQLQKKWNTLSPEQRLEEQIKIYVSDLTNNEDTEFSFEII